MDRRKFLLTTALTGANAAGVAACSGSGEPGNRPAQSVGAITWDVVPAPFLIAGSPDVVYDLQASLPATVRRGGRFAVSSTGTQLPPGIALSPSGVLSVTGAATEGVTQGVVFTYDEPSA